MHALILNLVRLKYLVDKSAYLADIAPGERLTQTFRGIGPSNVSRSCRSRSGSVGSLNQYANSFQSHSLGVRGPMSAGRWAVTPGPVFTS